MRRTAKITQTVVLLLATVAAVDAAAQTPATTSQSGSLREDYRVGARDLLEIRVFGLDQFDTNLRVSEAGTITLPLLGELRAAGLTRAELEEAVALAMARYVNDPQVSIFIREYQSQRFSIIGAVSRPGMYEMVGRKSLLEAISEAGGIDDQESAGSVTILRGSGDSPPIEIELDRLLQQGDVAFNIDLEPGDTVNVNTKPRFRVYVYGQVRRPGQFEVREELTLLQVVSLAGGLADRARASKVSILRRKPDGTQERLQINLQEIVEGNKPDVPVLPNDVVIVPETLF